MLRRHSADVSYRIARYADNSMGLSFALACDTNDVQLYAYKRRKSAENLQALLKGVQGKPPESDILQSAMQEQV